jgi:hypothetical protein
MMKSGGESWAIYYIAEEYDPKLGEICGRFIFAHEPTGEKWIRERLENEKQRIDRDNPGLPLGVVVYPTTGEGKYFGLESEGDQYLGYYLSPARFYP